MLIRVYFTFLPYNLYIMRHTACAFFNPVLVDSYSALFSSTAVVQGSDSMAAST